jgi:hypothetical protein
MFSEIDGVKGESKDKTHAKQTDVLSWSWAMSTTVRPMSAATSSRQGQCAGTSGSPSTCLEEVCDPEAALELASTPKGLLSPGVLLAQHYRLLEEVGDSPQGRLFLTEDLQQRARDNAGPKPTD